MYKCMVVELKINKFKSVCVSLFRPKRIFIKNTYLNETIYYIDLEYISKTYINKKEISN